MAHSRSAGNSDLIVAYNTIIWHIKDVSQLLDEIRAAILASEHSRYRIAKETGIGAPQLLRLVRGECGLSIEALERLAEFLALEIVVRSKRGRRRKE